MLGFENEASALVEIYEARAGGSVGMFVGNRVFEDVLVAGIVGDGGVRTRDGEEVAEFGEEELIVGAFSGGGVLPASDEFGGCHSETVWITGTHQFSGSIFMAARKED